MIVDHDHKFIFLKTHKTAGTSVEIFLQNLVGADAVVTPITPPVPGHMPRNHAAYFNPVRQIVRERCLRPTIRDLRSRRRFYNHIPASLVKERVGARVWNSYFKFCFERNPWEKVISYYYFKFGREPAISFETFVRTQTLPTDFDIYSLKGRVAVDFVGQFDQLIPDLTKALSAVGIGQPVTLTREKSGDRAEGATVSNLFTPELESIVEQQFAREIAEFGYCART